MSICPYRPVSPAILKPTWEKELPGIGAITRTVARKWVLHHEESFIHEQVLLVDPEFLEVFTFPLRQGNSSDALRDPFSMLTREIVLIIVLATLIGGTVGWYASRAWLSHFSSRFDMGIDLVLASMMITLLMAILPLDYRIVKSVMANPVNALRTE